MADLSDLISLLALGEAKKSIAAEDPYLEFQAIPDALSQTIIGHPTASNTEKIIGGLITGALSGIGSGLSADYQDRAINAYEDVLAQGISGEVDMPELERPSVLTPSLFRDAKDQAAKYTIFQALKDKESRQASLLKREEKLTDALLGAGYVQRDNGSVVKIPQLDPIELASTKARAEAKARKLGEYAAYDSLGGGKTTSDLPLDPEARSKAIRDMESEAYNRIAGLPSYKTFTDVEGNFKTLIALKDKTDAASGIAMITSLVRLLDPNSTAREGEVNTISKNVQSVLDQVAGNWRLAFKGESPLSQKAKQGIVNVAAEKYNSFGEQYAEQSKNILDVLMRRGGKTENVPLASYKKYEPNPLDAYTPEQIAYMKAKGMID